MNVLMV
jgi:hypothetical protein